MYYYSTRDEKKSFPVSSAQAIKQGKSHTHTVVTVAGNALPAPRNFRVGDPGLLPLGG